METKFLVTFAEIRTETLSDKLPRKQEMYHFCSHVHTTNAITSYFDIQLKDDLEYSTMDMLQPNLSSICDTSVPNENANAIFDFTQRYQLQN